MSYIAKLENLIIKKGYVPSHSISVNRIMTKKIQKCTNNY